MERLIAISKQKAVRENLAFKRFLYKITGVPDAYIAADDIEYGFNQKIPLWLFGFLY